MSTYRVCDACTTAIENDDWTHLDEFVTSPEESLEIHTHHLAMVESMGNATRTAYDGPGTGDYFLCWICNGDSLGFNVYTTDDEQPTAPEPTTRTLELTFAELTHVRYCLQAVKDEATKHGCIWPDHQMNANIRTTIERVIR